MLDRSKRLLYGTFGSDGSLSLLVSNELLLSLSASFDSGKLVDEGGRYDDADNMSLLLLLVVTPAGSSLLEFPI